MRNNNKKNKLLVLLKKAGLKVTPPRLSVLSVLHNTKYPMNIKDISKQLKGKMDTVTIYRTLNAFKKAQIVNQIDLQKNSAHYELKDEAHDHHHIVCTGCDKLADFVGCEFKTLSDKVLAQTPGFSKITSHSFEFFGICNTCNSK